jgi:RNA polymerase sigma-70 factor (ECF subfamily)
MRAGKIKNKNLDPDRKLVEKAQSGNNLAFGKLVEKYQKPVLNLVYDYVGDYEIARDIAQDVFLKVMVNLSGFSGKAKFSTWLYRVAVNACLDVKRKNKKSRFRLFSDTDAIDKQAIKDNRKWDDFPEMDLYISRLTDQQRTAIILRFYHHKTVIEIAEIMECSPNTVRTHLYRGIEKLRRMLKKDR